MKVERAWFLVVILLVLVVKSSDCLSAAFTFPSHGHGKRSYHELAVSTRMIDFFCFTKTPIFSVFLGLRLVF